jgi:hypothetical protein
MVTFMQCLSGRNSLQVRVYLPWPAAFRGVAGDIDKIRFLMATGTFIRGPGRSDSVLAIAAPPIRQIALGTDIPRKLS